MSVNARAGAIFDELCQRSEELRVVPHDVSGGGTLLDAGCHCVGSVAAGLLIARICTGGLSRIEAVSSGSALWPTNIQVATSQPLLACLGCQYAGWNLSVTSDAKTYRAMASGPGRIVCAKETLIQELGFSENEPDQVVFVLEADELPPDEIFATIAGDCQLSQDQIKLVVTPTGSLAGCVQIGARVVEVAMHQAHELHFPVDKIVEGFGTTPMAPPVKDFMQAMGRTNDSILFGGSVHLIVDTTPDEAKDLAEALPSNTSKDYGRPFGQIFKECNYDFFAVDPGLFSPAAVTITALSSGESFNAGAINSELLHQSFGLG